MELWKMEADPIPNLKKFQHREKNYWMKIMVLGET
jgi:hypothetical protein